ncbi:hypothetical protein B0H14DRAFT_2606312 [Mycena olivaceomarginata]|nr:hypothetical protein B0H14DRAFT_2606312 [Mycena olivaceomarginata]
MPLLELNLRNLAQGRISRQGGCKENPMVYKTSGGIYNKYSSFIDNEDITYGVPDKTVGKRSAGGSVRVIRRRGDNQTAGFSSECNGNVGLRERNKKSDLPG